MYILVMNKTGLENYARNTGLEPATYDFGFAS